MTSEATTEAGATDELAPLLTLRDPHPVVMDDDAGLARAAAAIKAGTGPVAIDAERASGYRYSNRAYLIQIARAGTDNWLIDPISMTSMAPLIDALDGTEWVLHAATQDLPCLGELGLFPAALFDTELAGRLLGYPRVGLGTLTEEVLGWRMLKEHSAADWSTRPLPEAWLEYAALDVEVLVELRDALQAELVAAEKWTWAQQEFDALRSFQPAVRVEPWRRTSGAHSVRTRRGLAVVKALWEARDEIAQDRDCTPGRLIPDAAIIAASLAEPASRGQLLGTKGFHGRGAKTYVDIWMAAIDYALTLDEDELPERTPRLVGPPPPRAWADRDVTAARRLDKARAGIAALAEANHLPPENLLQPDAMRRVLWSPPETREPGDLLDEVVGQLQGYGARPWQIAMTASLLTDAILSADA